MGGSVAEPVTPGPVRVGSICTFLAAAAASVGAASGQMMGMDHDRLSLLGGDRSLPDVEAPAVEIGGLLHVRWDASIRQQDDAGTVDDLAAGFSLRRARLTLDGDIGGIDGTSYSIQTETSQGSGEVFLLDAALSHTRGAWRVRAGRFKVPFAREAIVGASRRLTIDTSPVTGIFGFSDPSFRSAGVEARRREGPWSMSVMLNDGSGGGRADIVAGETDLGLTARAERLFGGAWSRFDDLTSRRGEDLAVLVGAAWHGAVGEGDADGDGIARESLAEARWTVDATVEGDGWTVFGAVFGLHRTDQGRDEVQRYGASAHAGWYVADNTELYTQYSWATGEDDEGTLSTVIAGLNRYLAGQAVKVQVDVGVALEPVSSVFASSARAILPDAAGERGQVFVRTQVQLAF
jgi:hypothetical protein